LSPPRFWIGYDYLSRNWRDAARGLQMGKSRREARHGVFSVEISWRARSNRNPGEGVFHELDRKRRPLPLNCSPAFYYVRMGLPSDVQLD